MATYSRWLPVLALAAIGVAHASAPETNWTKSSIPPMELAKRVDDKLHSIKTTSMDYFYGFKTDVGQGVFSGMSAVKNQNVYRIEYPLVGATEDYGLRRETIIRNGNKISVATQDANGKGFKFVASSGPRTDALPKDIVDGWYRNNVKYLLEAIGTSATPLESLVKAASYHPELLVKSETRVIPFKGQSIRNYRITVGTKAKQGGGKASIFYEIVIGDKYFFPITMSNLKKEGQKRYLTSMFGTRWNPSPAQKWDPSDFNLKVSHVHTRGIQ